MRPMLAAKITKFEALRFPLLASPKLDGVRCLIKEGVALSRTLKPIPNAFIQSKLSNLAEFEGFDGELVVGEATGEGVMQRTTSGVMSFHGSPHFTYFVFDRWNSTEEFESRYASLHAFIPEIIILNQTLCRSLSDVKRCEERALALGYEGLILRSPKTLYKFGRSTEEEQKLLKLKRFQTSEAVVLRVNALEHNDNPAEVSELGLTKRSTAKNGKISLPMLGSVDVRDIETGVEFSIGSGFTEGQRLAWWQQDLIGRLLTYRHFAVSGVKEKPRFPTFVAFRSEEDL